MRQGPYGLYMFKPALKTKVFVKVGADVKYDSWTIADAKAHYDAGKTAASAVKKQQGALPAGAKKWAKKY